MKFSFFYSLLLTTLFTYRSSAAQLRADSLPKIPLTLADVWNRATQYSRAVRQKRLNVQGSAEQIKDARAARLPEIEVAGEYARVTNMPVYENGLFQTPEQFPVIHTFYQLGGSAYFNLYNGGKTNLEIAANKTGYHIAEEEQQQTASGARLQAAAYYLDMQRSLVFKELLLKDIAAQEKQLLQIRTLQKNGVILKSDVLRAELKLSRQKLALVTLENDLAVANQKLNILVGLPGDAIVIPAAAADRDTANDLPLSRYLEEGSSQAYPVRISEQETALSKLHLKTVKANVAPKIGLFADYNFTYPQIQFYPYSANLYGLGLYGVKASFALSSFYHNDHKTKAAELAYQSQEIEHAQTTDVVRQQISEAYLRYTEALNRIAVSRTNVRQATENRRIVNNTYFNQTSLITDLLDADTQLLQTRFDLAAAQIAAQLQYYQLQYITGKL